MGVVGLQAISVIDDHHLSIAPAPFGKSDDAVGRRADGSPGMGFQIYPSMDRAFTRERVGPDAKRTRYTSGNGPQTGTNVHLPLLWKRLVHTRNGCVAQQIIFV